MSAEKEKLLKLMRFWLFGTFLIVWSAITIYIGMFTNRDWFQAIRAGVSIWGTVGVLCIVWYYGYRAWLVRRED